MNYYSYINGGEWKARRASFLLRHGKRCRACGRTGIMEVHHRTYERMGAELDQDLVVLCDPCHALVHDIHKAMAFTSLDTATDVFIEQMQSAGQPKTAKRRKRRR